MEALQEEKATRRARWPGVRQAGAQHGCGRAGGRAGGRADRQAGCVADVHPVAPAPAFTRNSGWPGSAQAAPAVTCAQAAPPVSWHL